MNQEKGLTWEPNPLNRALIDEDTCIGCTKCIKACPTDAIIGASKSMHTIIADACTGCGLCIPPCPIDCISLMSVPEQSPNLKKENMDRWQERHQKQLARLENIRIQQQHHRETAKLTRMTQPLDARKQAIQESLQRVAMKKAKVSGDV